MPRNPGEPVLHEGTSGRHHLDNGHESFHVPFDNNNFYKTHGMEHHRFWEVVGDYLPLIAVFLISIIFTFVLTRMMYAQSDKKRR